MLGNFVERAVNINGKLDLIPLAATYDDTFTGVAAQDLDQDSKDIWLHVVTGDSDSSTGELAVEESDGDGYWTRLWTLPIAADLNELVKITRSKRYLRIPDPGLEATTTTTMVVTLYK